MTTGTTARTRTSADRRLTAVVLLAVVSLGLPWGRSRLQWGTEFGFVPGGCWTGADGWMFCDTASTVLHTTTEWAPPAAGVATSARVLVPLALVLLVLALRRRSQPLAVGFVAAAMLTPTVVGWTPTSGTLLFLVAAATGAVLLQRSGLLHRPPLRRSAQTST